MTIRDSRENAGVVDLRHNDELVFRLLERMDVWRMRCVERIDYSSALMTTRERTVQGLPLRPVLGDLIPDAEGEFWVRLPVGRFPRSILSSFDLTINGTPAYRIRGKDNVEILADYIEQLAWYLIEAVSMFGGATRDLEELLLDPLLLGCLNAICTFESEQWMQKRRLMEKQKAIGTGPLRAFLSEGLGYTLTTAVVDDWLERVEVAREITKKYTKPNDVKSASENPLLVVPTLKANGLITGVSDRLPEAVKRMTDFLRKVRDLEQDPRTDNRAAADSIREKANSFLREYALIGRYWTVLADHIISLDRPLTISHTETRAVELQDDRKSRKVIISSLSLARSDLGPTVIFSDAGSNHVGIRVADPNVDLAKRAEFKLENGETPSVLPDLARHKGEMIVAYSGNSHRQEIMDVGITLRPASAIRWIHWVVFLIVLLTIFAIALGRFTILHELRAAHVALLLTPSTFACSLLLARESSALSGGLAKTLRVGLSWVLAGLWLFAFALYLSDQIHVDQPKVVPSPSRSS